MKQASDIVDMAGGQHAQATAPGPLFRAGGLLGTQRFKPVSREVLDLDQSARLALIPGYHVATRGSGLNIGISVLEGVPSLQLPVAAFDPAEGDVLSRSWTSSEGESKSVELPAYAAQDVVDAGKRFDKHIRDNALEWTSKQGGAISAVAALARANDKTLPYASLFTDCAALMFCAAHKTGSASLDPSTTDKEVLTRSSVIDDQGYPLRGKVSMPRMVLYQLDSVLTLQTCCDLQEHLLADLATLRDQSGDVHKAWQHYFLVLAALCSNSTLIFKDQRRRAVDNQQKEYSVPESVQDISHTLDTLISQFHDWETAQGGSLNREEAAAAAEPFYYSAVNQGESGEGRDIENLDWWLQKLRA